MDLQDKVTAFERQSVDRFEPVLKLFNEAVHVGELAESGKPDEQREKLKKIGSNFRIGRKVLSFEFKKPWEFLLNLNSSRAQNSEFFSEKEKCANLRRFLEKVITFFAQHPEESL